MGCRLIWTGLRNVVMLGCLSGYAQAGLLEICKDARPVGALSGVSTFAIAGQPGTVPVPVGACSPAIQLPDGFATITELPQPGASLLDVSTFPSDRLVSFDATTASAVVLLVPGDISTQTVITFTNAPVTGVPEPGTGWLFGLGSMFLALQAKPKRAMGGREYCSPTRRMKNKMVRGGELNLYEIARASTSSCNKSFHGISGGPTLLY
jgi:PEP-CTERM motif